jgi:hypothetical protein
MAKEEVDDIVWMKLEDIVIGYDYAYRPLLWNTHGVIVMRKKSILWVWLCFCKRKEKDFSYDKVYSYYWSWWVLASRILEEWEKFESDFHN